MPKALGTVGDRQRFCQAQRVVLIQDFRSMECNAFHAPHLLDKLPRRCIPWTGREDRRLSSGLDPAAGRAQPAPHHPGVRAKARPPHRRLHRGDRLRRRLDELTSALQPGDRLIVSELSRLGRSLGQVVAVLDALAKADVAFVALKENIHVEGKRDIQTKVMTTLFALFAEVERDLISERTREGLAKARASGRKLGRPKGSLGVSRRTSIPAHGGARLGEPCAGRCLALSLDSLPVVALDFRPVARLDNGTGRVADPRPRAAIVIGREPADARRDCDPLNRVEDRIDELDELVVDYFGQRSREAAQGRPVAAFVRVGRVSPGGHLFAGQPRAGDDLAGRHAGGWCRLPRLAGCLERVRSDALISAISCSMDERTRFGPAIVSIAAPAASRRAHSHVAVGDGRMVAHTTRPGRPPNAGPWHGTSDREGGRIGRCGSRRRHNSGVQLGGGAGNSRRSRPVSSTVYRAGANHPGSQVVARTVAGDVPRLRAPARMLNRQPIAPPRTLSPRHTTRTGRAPTRRGHLRQAVCRASVGPTPPRETIPRRRLRVANPGS